MKPIYKRLLFYGIALVLMVFLILMMLAQIREPFLPGPKPQSRIKQIGLAFKMDEAYAPDHHEASPANFSTAEEAFNVLIQKGYVSKQIFLPAHARRVRLSDPPLLQPGESAYGYVSGLTESNAANAIVIFENPDGAPSHNGMVNVGYMDGAVKSIPVQELTNALASVSARDKNIRVLYPAKQTSDSD